MSMQIILLAPLAATAAFALVGYSNNKMRPYGAMFVTIAIAAAIVTMLPWRRLFLSKWGMRIVYAWSAVDVLLITLGIWIAGGPRSDLVFLYALTTVFFAISFPPRAQLFLLALTIAGYTITQPVTGSGLLPLVTLALLAFLANFLARELRQQRSAYRHAHLESERRWTLAATVSAAARNMTTDPRGVLGGVVDAIVHLGYQSARIYVRHEQGAIWEVLLPGGASDECPEGPHCLPLSVHRSVLGEGRPLIVRQGDRDPEARRVMAQLGFEAMVAVPILVQDRAEAVMIVGTADAWEPSLQDLEAFQMLAAQAGVALENAHSFEEQRRTVERMAELDQLKSDFLSTVSHELRTPLTVISGMGLTLERQWSILDEEIRLELLARLNANAQALEGIITRLLDFSRFEAGRLDVLTEEVDLGALLEGLVARLEALTVDHVLTVEVDAGLSVKADRVLLERVYENLLSNAVKYTPIGSRIRISSHSEDNEAIIAVSDNGPGISEEELPHLGERFFRGGDPQTRTTRGTGLGLSLVSEILRLHGSELEIETQLGAGATFSFRLPTVAPVAMDGEGGSSLRVERGDQVVFPPPPQRSDWEDDVVRGERFETVLAGAQMGTEWAIAALYHELNPRVLRYLKALRAQRPNDIASEVWLELASNLGRFDGDLRGFRRWVFAVARRRLIESGGRSPVAERLVHEPIVDPDDAPMELELRPSGGTGITESLAPFSALPQDQAEVVLLRFVGDLTRSEVADILGRRPAVIRSLEQQGLERLRREAALVAVDGGEAGGS